MKLVEVHNTACMKLSEDPEKITFPGKKDVYRLYDKNGQPSMDLITKQDEEPPKAGEPYLCRHPFTPTKRAFVVSSKVEKLYKLYWENGKCVEENMDTVESARNRLKSQIENLRVDHKRHLNPTPYKVVFFPVNWNFLLC